MALNWLSDQFHNGTSAQERLFSAIHGLYQWLDMKISNKDMNVEIKVIELE